MQNLLLPVTDTETIDNAKQGILNRSPLYDTDKNKLYIKYNDELNLIRARADNDNIIFNENDELALNDNIHCKSVTVQPENGICYKSNVLLAETSDNRTIILLMKYSDTKGVISGNIYIKGEDDSGGYCFTVSSAGTRYLEGASISRRPNYVKVTYNNEDYIAIQFGNNNKIYFSGYDLRPEEIMPPAYDTYNDGTLANIIELVDASNTNTSTDHITNPLSTNWDFTEYCEGLDEDHKTIPNTEYDLADGLFVNETFSGTVQFFPNNVVGIDKGYITIDGSGHALRVEISKENCALKFTYSADDNFDDNDEGASISISDSSTILDIAYSNSKEYLSTFRTPNLTTGTYYINATNKLRIYRVALIPPQIDILEEAHDDIHYEWPFISEPENWTETENTDWGNGLTMIRSNGGDYTVYDTTQYNDRGYIVCSPGYRNIFSLNIPYSNAMLSIKFTTDRRGGARQVRLLNAENTIIKSVETPQYPSALSDLTCEGLSKGKYYIYETGPCQIYNIQLTIPYAETVIGEVSYADQVTDVIQDFNETGELGDPNYVKVSDIEFSLADLEKIASTLRDSDRKVHLDLSECSVKEDATDWERLFNKCLSLSYIAMPQGVTKVGTDTFVGCIFLEKIKFCESLTTFESDSHSYIFTGNRIRTYILPKNCSKIGWNTFANSGARHIIVPPDSVHSFKSMLSYGSFFDTLDYIKIYMTQEEFEREDYTLSWEHDNYMGDSRDTSIADHITIYTDLDELLGSLNYGEK